MADALSNTIKAEFDWVFQETLDLSNVTDQARVQYNVTTADGTANSQADKIWHDTRSILTTANDDLDLTALTTSIFGSTVTISFVEVVAILIINTNTLTGELLEVGGSGGNEFVAWVGAAGDKVKVGPNSVFMIANVVDGYAVANGSTDILRIRNPGATTVTYKIAIVGRSA